MRRPPLVLKPVAESDGVPPTRCNLISVESGRTPKSYCNSVDSFETLANSVCVGRNFSKLILIDGSVIILHDVFTGEQIRSPSIVGLGIRIGFGMLTAPLHSSSLSLVLVAALRDPEYIFCWEPNGSGDRDGKFVVDKEILYFASCNDQVYCLGIRMSVGILELEPKLKVNWKVHDDTMFLENLPFYHLCCGENHTVIECDGELLIVLSILIVRRSDYSTKFVVHKFDSDKCKWVKKEKLNNWCLFIDYFGRVGFSCKDPEIWGGRSNCIYFAAPDCVGYRICPLNGELDASRYTFSLSISGEKCVEWPWLPFWVYPSIKSVEEIGSGKAHLKSTKG